MSLLLVLALGITACLILCSSGWMALFVTCILLIFLNLWSNWIMYSYARRGAWLQRAELKVELLYAQRHDALGQLLERPIEIDAGCVQAAPNWATLVNFLSFVGIVGLFVAAFIIWI